MKILEVTGDSYPDAHELPNKRSRPAAKRMKPPQGGNSSTPGKNRYAHLPHGPVKLTPGQQEALDRQMAAGRKVLVITAQGKRRFVPAERTEQAGAEEEKCRMGSGGQRTAASLGRPA